MNKAPTLGVGWGRINSEANLQVILGYDKFCERHDKQGDVMGRDLE